MLKEIRKVIYDNKLDIEALNFYNIKQSFKKHFHDYYVIGYVKKCKRELICNDLKYNLKGGELILINPNDYHQCNSIENEIFEYGAIHITKEKIKKLASEIFNINEEVKFKQTVIKDFYLKKEFYNMIKLIFKNDFKKEELFYLVIKELLQNYGDLKKYDFKENENISSLETEKVLSYIHKNYNDNLSLDELAKVAGISKYYFIRLFTKYIGITPYQYLEIYRINKAKRMLQKGIPIIDAAISNGFSDQSHFTNLLKKTIGITPKQYRLIFENINKINKN